MDQGWQRHDQEDCHNETCSHLFQQAGPSVCMFECNLLVPSKMRQGEPLLQHPGTADFGAAMASHLAAHEAAASRLHGSSRFSVRVRLVPGSLVGSQGSGRLPRAHSGEGCQHGRFRRPAWKTHRVLTLKDAQKKKNSLQRNLPPVCDLHLVHHGLPPVQVAQSTY